MRIHPIVQCQDQEPSLQLHPATCPECCKQAMIGGRSVGYLVSEGTFAIQACLQASGEWLREKIARLFGKQRTAPQQSGMVYEFSEVIYVCGQALLLVWGGIAAVFMAVSLIVVCIFPEKTGRQRQIEHLRRKAREQAEWEARKREEDERWWREREEYEEQKQREDKLWRQKRDAHFDSVEARRANSVPTIIRPRTSREYPHETNRLNSRDRVLQLLQEDIANGNGDLDAKLAAFRTQQYIQIEDYNCILTRNREDGLSASSPNLNANDGERR